MSKMRHGFRVSWVAVTVASIIFSVTSAAQAQKRVANLIIRHARIYTVNEKQPWAEALAVAGDKILAVGTEKDIEAYRGSSTKVVDAEQHLVLPGFTDAHVHFLDGAFSLLHVNLENAKTIPEIQKMVKEFADKHPSDGWLLGRGWSYPVFAPTGMPDKKYLDEIVPDRPVYLEGFDGHTWWANSKALQVAGITRDTPDPPNGTIVRDPVTGEATGAIKEDAADAVIRRAIPLPTRQEKLNAFLTGMREANHFGVVRIHSAGGVNIGSGDLQNADLLQELRGRGQLSVRMYLAYRLDPPEVTAKQLDEIEAARRQYHDEWVSAGSVKFFMDGVIESHTAAMLQPYADDPKLTSSTFWSEKQYQQAVNELDKRGIQIFTHAIGDKAVRVALDSYEQAARANSTSDRRHRIEHIETIAAADIPRFGKLGVIASMQPLHAYPDDDTLKIWARNTGAERASRAWAWRSIRDGGGVLAFGSDWPIVTINPWPGVQTAVTRQTADGQPPEGFVPQQRLTIADAIKSYTLGAAVAGRREKTEGSLEPGKVADFIILKQDVFKVEPSEIGKTEVLETVVGGRTVYESPEWKTGKTASEKK